MAPLSTAIEVARPPEEVFAYVTDPTHFVDWQEGVVSGHMEGDGPQAAGDICMTTRRIGFADRPVTAEVTSIRGAPGESVGSTGRSERPST